MNNLSTACQMPIVNHSGPHMLQKGSNKEGNHLESTHDLRNPFKQSLQFKHGAAVSLLPSVLLSEISVREGRSIETFQHTLIKVQGGGQSLSLSYITVFKGVKVFRVAGMFHKTPSIPPPSLPPTLLKETLSMDFINFFIAQLYFLGRNPNLVLCGHAMHL